VIEQIDIAIKYEGYIKRQQSQANDYKRQENRKLPEGIVFSDIKGLRIEARQKLEKVRPQSIGQASRISGVNPADIAALLIWLDREKAAKEK
jgi:tRNA uridine 5-carboxymethylaminomethyl modification enzyme